MRINKIILHNFKCFANREFELAPRFNLIVGDNAKGKTALLDGLAVGIGALLLGMRSGSRARSIYSSDVRREYYHRGDTVTVESQTPSRIECEGSIGLESGRWSRELGTVEGRTSRRHASWIVNAARRLERDVKEGGPAALPLIACYGTGRMWVRHRQTTVSTLRPESRLVGYRDWSAPASDERRLVAWFKTREVAMVQRRESSPTLEACRRAILDCLPEARHVYFDVVHDELMLDLGNREMPFGYLSDGYRNMLGLAADLAIRCATLNPHLREHAAFETTGVVLIDEIDLHLHPLWQGRVVTDLLRAFPSMQFVATSHSPFVIQSLPPQEGVHLINLDDKSSGFADKSVEDIAEEVQGVELPQRSRRFVDMLKAAQEYYEVLEKADSASVQDRERLRKHLDELSLPFADDAAYQAFLKMQRTASGIDKEGE